MEQIKHAKSIKTKQEFISGCWSEDDNFVIFMFIIFIYLFIISCCVCARYIPQMGAIVFARCRPFVAVEHAVEAAPDGGGGGVAMRADVMLGHLSSQNEEVCICWRGGEATVTLTAIWAFCAVRHAVLSAGAWCASYFVWR